MIALLFLLIGLRASLTWGQDFACGFEGSKSGAQGASGHSEAYYRSGTIRSPVLFGKFNGARDRGLTRLYDRDGLNNQRADSLLARNHTGSLAHYFSEMSNGALTLAPPVGGINTTWFEAVQDTIADYITSPTCNNRSVSTWAAAVRRFVREVIQDADDSIDFTAYDGPDSDTDVDLVIVIVPRDFGDLCGPNGTVFYASDFSPRLSVDGVSIEAVITAEFRPSMPWLAGVLAHEYGHVMGLPELFDRSHLYISHRTNLPQHSAGIGRWGVMAGSVGWPHVPQRDSGPNPFSVWSRIEVGWITPDTVTADRLDVRIHDINSTNGRAYRLPVSSSEYFLVANRQNGYPTVGSYYDSLAPASGLAIWHVDESVSPGALDANIHEAHKRVDLECADGLFSDRGYPGTMPDAVAGGDNLDFWAADSTYRANQNGHNDRGDATDLWNGSAGDLTTDTAFTPYTNPSTAGYHDNGTPSDLVDDRQNVRTGIAVRDIRTLPGGIVQADFHLNYWSGSIATNTTWSGTVTVGGDVTVASGATLTLAAGTEVRFLANTDDTGSGTDATKSELIVSGTLNAGAGNITLRSTNADPDTAEWYGVRVLSGGSADLTNATLRDGVRCVRNAGTLTLSNTRFSDCGLIAGADSVSYAENRTDTVATYTATNPASTSSRWTWSRAGPDSSAFTGGDTLRFAQVPDFEDPDDADSNNVYTLQVQAADGQLSATKSVRVQVTNADEPGAVSLSSSSPRVDTLLTATLTDPDTVRASTVRWQWQRSPSGSSSWTDISGSSLSSYTPQSGDVGRRLRATVSYTDGQGPGKSAQSAATAAVVDAPSAPSLTAMAGDRRVALSWTAADSNGAWVSGYSLRDSSAGGSWSSWSAVPGGGAARDTTRSKLTNGTLYTFEVRAQNRVGHGDSSRVSATPQARTLAGPDSISYAENGTDTVAVYRVTPGGGSWTWSRAGADRSAFSGGDTLRFARAPNFEVPTDSDSNNVYTLQVQATPSAPGLSSLSKAVVVTVTNVNEPGAISFSPSRPKVNQTITATLSDADTVASVSHWRWLPYIEGGIGIGGEEAEETATAAATICPGMVSCTYTPGLFFRYLPLEVTVFYADHLASGQQVQVVTAAVGGPNRAPTLSGVSDTTFVENDTAAVALYRGADADGDALRWSLTGADSSAFRWQGRGLTRALRFAAAPDYEAKSTYRVTAGVSDGAVAATQAVTVRVTNVDEAPVLSGPADTTVVEHGSGTVALYRAVDPEGEAVTWSLSGADRDTLALSGGGQLSFKRAPDYERPADAGSDNVYAVRVRAFDGPLGDSLAVTVRVSNVEEAGTVSLSSSSPQAGTALSATLSDPDSVWASTVGWQWQRLSSRSAAGTPIGSATSASYTPQAEDVDQWLVARASYRDGHGAGKSAADTTAASVAGRPGAPESLAASAGDTQVALSWTAADSNGAWVTGYSLRDSLAGGSWSSWTVVPGGGAARKDTVTGLTNDTLYTFEVRAKNKVGTGDSSRVSARPQAVPPAPDTLIASAGNRRVALSWTYTSSVPVTRWQERHKAGSRAWGSWTDIANSSGSTRSYTVTGLTNDTLYTFEVRGVNGKGAGTASNPATATPWEDIPPILSGSAGNRQVALSWTYTGKAPVSSWQYRRESALGDFSGQGQQTSTRIWGPWTPVPGSNGSTRSYTVTGLTNGSKYGFEVRGLHGSIKRTASNKVIVTPQAAPPPAGPPPATLSASAGNAQVALSWTYSSTSKVTGWQQRHKAGSKTWGSWTGVAGSTGSTRKDTVTGLTNDTLYTFEVRGLNGEVNGTASNQVTATPKAPPPPPKTIPPPVLSATAGNKQVALSWTYTSTETVTGWQYRRESALGDFSAGQKTSTRIWGPWTPISGAATRNHTVTGLTNGSEYGFEVRGVNGSIKGTTSNKVTVTPKAPPPPAPPAPTLSASAGNGRVTLSWAYTSTVTVTGWQYRRESDFEDLSGGQKTTTRVWGPWKSISGAATRSHTVTQLTNGSEYGFEVRGVNGKTEGTASNKVTATPKAPATVPGAPGSLSASAGNKQVTLSWSAAASNGSAIQRYEYRRGSGSWTTVSGGGSARSQTVTGLTNGTSYTFSVRAVNGVGAGTAASASATPAGRPGSPGGLSASASNRQVTLSWSAAASNGSAIQRYEYRRGSGGWTTVSGGGSARSQTVTGLTNGTSYTFSVRAVNGVGAGTAASASATPAGRPGSPGSLSASAGNKQVTLSWSAAASNGSAIQRYEYRRGLLGSWTTVSGGGSARSQTVTGLTNGTTYLFYVRAVNGKGAGSAASASAKPAGVPGSPGGLSAAAGFGQVTLSWSAAASNGSAIQRYEYQHSGNSWATVSGGSGARSQTVTGLTGGVSYTFYVRAVNGVGAGTAASKSAVPIDDFALGANQPNPFNPETTLRYALPEAQPVRLTVYDMLGQQVRVLVDGEQPPGWHQVVWDGRDQVGRPVASGIYLYRLQTPQFAQTRKMILLR